MSNDFMLEKHFTATLGVTKNGVRKDYGEWSSLDGGDSTTEVTKTFPGGMKPEVAIPSGQKSISTITLKRQFDRMRDAMSAFAELDGYVGSGAEATVAQQPLGNDGVAFGTPIVDRGPITGVTRPKYDANSTTEATFEVTIEPHGR